MEKEGLLIEQGTQAAAAFAIKIKELKDSFIGGIVDSVDATRIVVKAEGEAGAFPDIYRLGKFARSNQSTSYTQKPVVRTGEHVRAGDVIADGPSCDMGELALGRNVVVAFMPGGGYNFERKSQRQLF